MAEYGMVVDVTLGDPDGTEAVVAASAGDASLTVDYASDWSVPRRVQVNETTVKVTAITEGAGEGDPDVLTLAAPLEVDVAVGDLVVPLVGGEPVLTWEVHVDLGDGHPVDVPIPFEMRPLWELFTPREPWPVVLSDDLERILEVPGRRPVIDSSFVNLDFEHAEVAYSPTSDELTAGTFSHQLLHTNIAPQSGLFTTINGVALGADSWSLDPVAGVVTVTIPDWVADAPSDRREFGWPMYAYRRGVAVDPPEVDPVTPTWIVPQAISDYTDSAGTYHASGPLTGQPLSVAQPSVIGFNGAYGFYWTLPDDFETFAALGVTGIKIVGTFDGNGVLGFDWSLDNPLYSVLSGDAGWPDNRASGSHITLDSYAGDPSLPYSIHVDGPTTFEHTFAVNATASDPYYEGNDYSDILGKLEVSLHALAGDTWPPGSGDAYNHVYGTIEDAGDGTDNVQILSFDLVLIGTPS